MTTDRKIDSQTERGYMISNLGLKTIKGIRYNKKSLNSFKMLVSSTILLNKYFKIHLSIQILHCREASSYKEPTNSLGTNSHPKNDMRNNFL